MEKPKKIINVRYIRNLFSDSVFPLTRKDSGVYLFIYFLWKHSLSHFMYVSYTQVAVSQRVIARTTTREILSHFWNCHARGKTACSHCMEWRRKTQTRVKFCMRAHIVTFWVQCVCVFDGMESVCMMSRVERENHTGITHIWIHLAQCPKNSLIVCLFYD